MEHFSPLKYVDDLYTLTSDNVSSFDFILLNFAVVVLH